ncbi:hypothetical protein UFOVP470_15 [uncultured Caudovirales phage]|uniref:Tail fiber protein n=1 Tax=uncultured Caudovirales phage TaxID=2100421 RepID=A0A6J5MFM3_9CAUD|nr:hypothetical protein UFOVP470_15 [uncultured Caudovirales phage]
MTKYLFKNNATGSLAASISSLDVTLTLTVGEGSFFPLPVAGEAFRITVQSGTLFEIMECTARSGDILTVVRARESTTGRAWAAGASVDQRLTAGIMDAVRDNTPAIQTVAALTPAANYMAYYSGSSSASLTSLTAYARTLIGSADAAAARSILDAVGTAATQTLTNKTLTAPTLDQPVVNGASGALAIPAGPDTLVGRASTDTLTNKTLTSPVINGGSVAGASGVFTTLADAIGGVRVVPQNAQTAAYVLLAADAGKHISITTGGITVPPSVFAIGENITIYNNSASNQTITQGAGVTIRLAGTVNTGTRTILPYGLVTVMCVSANTFVATGAGLT